MKFYDDHAERYAAQTLSIDMTSLYERFLSYLPAGAKILDAGCGPGRDLRFFRSKGYHAEGFDSSIEMVKLALKENLPVRHLSFEQVDWSCCFDAVWASASLLHLPKSSVPSAVMKLVQVLKEKGVLYASLKVGEGESLSEDGRFFSYYREEEVRQMIAKEELLEIRELWMTQDGASRAEVQWLNIIAVRR